MVFSVDQVLASQIKTEEETSWAIGLPSLIHKSGSIQHSKTVQFPKLFSHYSPFFGGPSLSIPDQDWGRDFMGEATYNVGQRLVTRLWYTVQDPFSTARQSSFQNSFHTLLLVFSADQVLALQIKTARRLHGWSWLHIVGQLFVNRLWYISQDPFSTARQSSFQNYFHTLLLVFCRTKS